MILTCSVRPVIVHSTVLPWLKPKCWWAFLDQALNWYLVLDTIQISETRPVVRACVIFHIQQSEKYCNGASGGNYCRFTTNKATIICHERPFQMYIVTGKVTQIILTFCLFLTECSRFNEHQRRNEFYSSDNRHDRGCQVMCVAVWFCSLQETIKQSWTQISSYLLYLQCVKLHSLISPLAWRYLYVRLLLECLTMQSQV